MPKQEDQSRNGLTFEDLETFLLRKLAARADFFFTLQIPVGCKMVSDDT